MNQSLAEVQLSGIVKVRDELLKLENPLRLESGDPVFNTPEFIKEAAVKALMEDKTHYVNSQGIMPFRESIKEKLSSENRVNVDVNDIIAVNGGMHGLFITISALVGEGDEVIIPTPNWTAVQWII